MNLVFSEMGRKAIEYGRDEAVRLGHEYIGIEHFLLGIIGLNEGRAIEIMKKFGFDFQDFLTSMEGKAESTDDMMMVMTQLPLSYNGKCALTGAGDEARNLKANEIEPEHLFLAMLKFENEAAVKALAKYKINYDSVFKALEKKQDGDSSSLK
jgi:ATP-dependent Clp protease ATP-binding subunit ClpC